MKFSTPFGASAYASVGLETGVAAANPHRLILMLYDGAIEAISRAQTYMGEGDTVQKGRYISKAIEIIRNGLIVSLDRSAGGELAESLSALYEYMCDRLLKANMTNDTAILAEIRHLVADLRDAWDAIDPTRGNPLAAHPNQASQNARV